MALQCFFRLVFDFNESDFLLPGNDSCHNFVRKRLYVPFHIANLNLNFMAVVVNFNDLVLLLLYRFLLGFNEAFQSQFAFVRMSVMNGHFAALAKELQFLLFVALLLTKFRSLSNAGKVVLLKVFECQHSVFFVGSHAIMKGNTGLTPESKTLKAIKTVCAPLVTVSTIGFSSITLFNGQHIKQTVDSRIELN